MALAFLILRLGLGLNIFMHGFTRLQAGRKSFQAALQKEFAESILPTQLVSTFGTLLPVLETLIGVFLLLGLFTEFSIISGSVLMLLLIFGKSLKSDWQIVSFQMIYVAFYAALAFLKHYNSYSLDNIFFKYY